MNEKGIITIAAMHQEIVDASYDARPLVMLFLSNRYHQRITEFQVIHCSGRHVLGGKTKPEIGPKEKR